MGNASGKERPISPPNPHLPSGHSRSGSSSSRYRSGSTQERNSASMLGGASSRSRDTSNRNHNLENTLFGLGFASGPSRAERSVARREDEREAREARRAEREREKEAERQRSLREESLDGGFLVTQGVYTGPQDFKEKIVRHLMIERKLAPFYKGLSDHDESWTDAQLVAAVRGLPIPGPDAEVPPDISPPVSPDAPSKNASESNLHLTVPIASRSRSHSYTSDSSTRSGGAGASCYTGSSRARSKTLSISSPRNPVQAATATNPLETNIPGRTVDGRPIEAVLYREAKECPICFLYYPPWQNKTRCCDQEICSECFVQIKRADPHLPEHDTQPANAESTLTNPDMLISEPASCPFCKETDFGVTYSPPHFRRGLVYSDSLAPTYIPSPNPGSPNMDSLDLSAPSSPSIPASPPTAFGIRRKVALASNAPEVVTVDQVRPDWAHKLAAARSQAARRAAAATALHTAAFLMSNSPSASESRGPGFTSRRLMRRAALGAQGAVGSESPSSGNSGAGTPRRNSNGVMGNSYGGFGIGALSERNASPVVGGGRGGTEHSASHGITAAGLSLLGVTTENPESRENGNREEATNRRRSRMVDLEEMMLREAIRLSLVEEEERRKKEEKEAVKNAKKKEKEGNGGRKSLFGRLSGNSSSAQLDTGEGSGSGKGKTVDRSGGSPLVGEQSARPRSTTASASSASSFDENTIGAPKPHVGHSSSTNNSQDNLADFTLSFSSLAGMVGDGSGASIDESNSKTGQPLAPSSTSEASGAPAGTNSAVAGEKTPSQPIVQTISSSSSFSGSEVRGDSKAAEAGIRVEGARIEETR